jgi:hypothetical protein
MHGSEERLDSRGCNWFNWLYAACFPEGIPQYLAVSGII